MREKGGFTLWSLNLWEVDIMMMQWHNLFRRYRHCWTITREEEDDTKEFMGKQNCSPFPRWKNNERTNPGFFP